MRRWQWALGFVLAVCELGVPGVAWAVAPTLDVRIDRSDLVLPLFFDKRVTLVFPEDVRLAVPGSPDVLSAHIKDHVVVVSLVDSPYVRQRRPSTNLTVLTQDGTPFTCRIEVAAGAEGAGVDLVRVGWGSGRAVQAGLEARRVVGLWLREGPEALAPETAEALGALGPLVEARARRQVAQWAAVDGVVALRGKVRKTKRAFIYLESRGGVQIGDHLVLSFGLSNHSQTPFSVGAVRLLVDGRAVHELQVEVPERRVSPDGRARGVGVVAPWSEVASGRLAVEICEDVAMAPRCVGLEVR